MSFLHTAHVFKLIKMNQGQANCIETDSKHFKINELKNKNKRAPTWHFIKM